MNEKLEELYSLLDKAVAKSLKDAGSAPPCCKGCFHCCREPVYVSLSEVKNMIELLTPEKRAAVAERTREWLADFKASGMDKEVEPPAVKYRSFNLWCPLLDGVKCSVYERRPVGCRTHFAQSSKDGCEDDALREHHKFVLFEGLDQALLQWQTQRMKDGESETYDSLGILLAKELLGEDYITHARLIISVKGDNLDVQRYVE